MASRCSTAAFFGLGTAGGACQASESVDGVATDYLYVDQVLYGFISEFSNQRGAFQKSLEKEFMTLFKTFSTMPDVSFDIFHKMIENISMGNNSADVHDPLIQNPGEISKTRAFVLP